MSETTRWILPVLIGPQLSLCGLVTLLALHARPGERLHTWCVLMVFAAILAAAQSAGLAIVDFAGAALRRRRLPVGLRAWGAAIVAPLCSLWIWLLVHPPTERLMILWIVLLAAACAVPLRLFFGARWRAP